MVAWQDAYVALMADIFVGTEPNAHNRDLSAV